MSEPLTEAESQDSAFTALGFGKNARKNLVIAIMVIQFGAIGYLFKQNGELNQKIIDIKTAQADSINAQYSRLVFRVQMQLQPVQEQARQVASNVTKTDSLQQKLNAQ